MLQFDKIFVRYAFVTYKPMKYFLENNRNNRNGEYFCLLKKVNKEIINRKRFVNHKLINRMQISLFKKQL